ncbi:MAG: DNA translocase FtsK [Lachnospiraceae bacterium]|nr:DNA translocase FtsK [Lachnospiraceae bacterium]
MATKKRTSKTGRKSNTRGKARNNRPSAAEVQKVEEFRLEVFLWIVIAICLLLFVSNFGIGGTVGNYISSFLFGIFGLMAYVFPILIIIACFFIISNKGSILALIKMFGSILLVAFLCMLCALIFSKDTMLTPMESFTYCFEHKLGGGIIGGFLAYYITQAFGVIGAYIIDAIVLIIALVLITEKSAIKGFQASGQKVYESARENNERYQEYRRLRAEEKIRRRDNKVSGVSIDTKIPEQSDLPYSDEMGEIYDDSKLELPNIKAERKTKLKSSETDTSHYAPLVMEDEKASGPTIVGDYVVEDNQEPVMERTSTRRGRASVEEIEKAVDNVANEIIAEETAVPERPYVFPPINLLKPGENRRSGNTQNQLRETALKLEQILKTFGVNVNVTDISCGPAVTRYELQPEIGVKVSKIVNLADDIKMHLAAEDIRIEAPIPGKAAVGIEVPNKEKAAVAFRDIVESQEFKNSSSKIAFAVGKDISGQIMMADIAKMPHVLIAGSTGSGKSVCINTIIMSILYKADPKDVKLIMIDPKVVELSVYNGIPHLMIPVVTDPKKAAGALHWAVAEMTERYQKFAEIGVRDIAGYNARVESVRTPEGQEPPKKMPQIVIIVDELADLMMVASNDVEEAICRLAQLARACGIHLVIATQRPSVNVITGLIKANMPSRIAFAVTSGVDSRTILDMNGAEKLLGKGDMLFNPQGVPKPIRVQGAFVSDKEVAEVVRFITEKNGNATYSAEVQQRLDTMDNSGNTTVSISGMDSGGDGRDSCFLEAAKIIIDKEKASIGMLQRYLKVGFNRAARIMDQLEEAGIVGPEEGTKPRKVLMSPEEFEVYLEENY